MTNTSKPPQFFGFDKHTLGSKQCSISFHLLPVVLIGPPDPCNKVVTFDVIDKHFGAPERGS